jgi:DNA-binding winged helix-turn-helix (wHTH) protein
VELRLLGPVSVEFGDRDVPITGGQPARVLRALAVTPRRRVTTDALVEAAWRGDPPANPAKALQTVVMRLRRTVDDGIVATVPGGYALGSEVTTDVERVDGLIDRGLEPGPPRDRAEALAGALVACTGPAFPGLDDWTPARAETARLAERIARAELLALRLELDGAGGTIAELETAVEHADALHHLAGPVTGLLVVNQAFMFLGSVAHHAGLAAAVAGRTSEAHDLLSSGLATHERLRSPHWTARSRRALETLRARA